MSIDRERIRRDAGEQLVGLWTRPPDEALPAELARHCLALLERLEALEAELEEATRALVRERVRMYEQRQRAETAEAALEAELAEVRAADRSAYDACCADRRNLEAALCKQRQRAARAEERAAELPALVEAARGLLAWVDGCRLPGAANAAGELRTALRRVAP